LEEPVYCSAIYEFTEPGPTNSGGTHRTGLAVLIQSESVGKW